MLHAACADWLHMVDDMQNLDGMVVEIKSWVASNWTSLIDVLAYSSVVSPLLFAIWSCVEKHRPATNPPLLAKLGLCSIILLTLTWNEFVQTETSVLSMFCCSTILEGKSSLTHVYATHNGEWLSTVSLVLCGGTKAKDVGSWQFNDGDAVRFFPVPVSTCTQVTLWSDRWHCGCWQMFLRAVEICWRTWNAEYSFVHYSPSVLTQTLCPLVCRRRWVSCWVGSVLVVCKTDDLQIPSGCSNCILSDGNFQSNCL